MHITVSIKRVPDSTQIRVHPVTNAIMHQGVPAMAEQFAEEEAGHVREIGKLLLQQRN
jgi:electron transfer flavoprotein beta subunit